MDNQDQASTPLTDAQPAFQLGICMAGAVSAGAYTAGVMDYLLEALEAYEKVRGTPGYPSHKIEIPAIGGASAGGMTAIIAAAALQQGIEHIDKPLPNLQQERPENILYHSWVDLTDPDMFGNMLSTGDISKENVDSAFNCKFIDEVAKRALEPAKPADFAWKKRPAFIAPDLKLFTTLSNLGGFSYNVNFNSVDEGSRRPYYMKMHNDYACFELVWDKDATAGKGWMPLNLEHKQNTTIAMQAAMATGAFPVGLKARNVTRPLEIVQSIPFFDDKTQAAIKDSLYEEAKEQAKKRNENETDAAKLTYGSLNVDGGMINNEPFDKIRELLNKLTGEYEIKTDNEPGKPAGYKSYEDYQAFKSTIIMIAPFPSSKPETIDQSTGLGNVVGQTLSAMISQMRSKPSQINDAKNSDCAGQYLIDPARDFYDLNGKWITAAHGETAIACGALGGFSGFINKEFRVHDYFIGRHNCKVFLKNYFTIPAKDKDINPIFKAGYAGITDDRYKAKDGSWQIIPIVDAAKPEFPKLKFSGGTDWPVQKEEAIDKYKSDVKNRLEAMVVNAITSVSPTVLQLGLYVLKGKLANKVLTTIKDELKKWHLIEE